MQTSAPLRPAPVLTALLAVVLALGTLAGPAGATWDQGRSTPSRDTVYTARGTVAVDVLHYDVRLRWTPQGKRLAGRALVHLRARRTAKWIRLDLAKPLRVTRVTVNGTPAPRRHRGHRLLVRRAVKVNRHYTVDVSYRGHPRPVADRTSIRSVDGLGWHTTRKGAAYTMQRPYGALTWMPANDTPGDKALWQVRLTVPAKWRGLSNGRLVASTRSGHRRTMTWRTDRRMAPYQATVAIGRYAPVVGRGPHRLPISVWVFPAQRRSLGRPLLQAARQVAWLERRLGRYPFESIRIVVPPSADMSPTQQTLTFGGTNFIYGRRDVRQQVVRLLVQQWYGAKVTPSSWRDLWLAEGYGEYLAARYTVDAGWWSWRDWTTTWSRNDAYWRAKYGPPGRYKPGEFGQVNVRYATARMLVRLRARIGKRAFTRTMKAWVQGPNRVHTRADYVRFMERRTHRPRLNRFYAVWLNRRASPR